MDEAMPLPDCNGEHWEPYELRGSRTVLGGPEGEIPSGYSSKAEVTWIVG
jgi:hypothetical protein